MSTAATVLSHFSIKNGISDISCFRGVILSSYNFACSLANAKKSFYRAFNAVFGKVAGVASEEVTVELLKALSVLKCYV